MGIQQQSDGIKAFYAAMPDGLVAGIYNDGCATLVADCIRQGWSPATLAAHVSDVGQAKNPVAIMTYRLRDAANQPVPDRGWTPEGQGDFDQAEARARLRLQEMAADPEVAALIASVRASLAGNPTAGLVLRNVIQERADLARQSLPLDTDGQQGGER